MRVYKVKVTTERVFTEETILDVIELAGYGIGYWAAHADIDTVHKVYRITEEDGSVHSLPFNLIAQALGNLPEKYRGTDYDLDEMEAGEVYMDSADADSVIQWALFGELVFG